MTIPRMTPGRNSKTLTYLSIFLTCCMSFSCSENRKPSDSNATKLENVYESCRESVVCIEAYWPDGSIHKGVGFFIDTVGHIATCYHLLADAESVKVMRNDGAKDSRMVEIVEADAYNDMAKIKIELLGQIAHALESDTSVRIGKNVILLVCEQDISSKERISLAENVIGNYTETELIFKNKYPQGFSGTPVISNVGKVLGMITSANENSYAVRIDLFSRNTMEVSDNSSAYERDNESARLMHYSAQKCMNSKEYEEAMLFLNQALKHCPRDTSIWTDLVICEIISSSGNPNKHIEKVLKMFPKWHTKERANMCCCFGNAYREIGNFEIAKRYYSKARRYDDQNQNAIRLLKEVEEQIGADERKSGLQIIPMGMGSEQSQDYSTINEPPTGKEAFSLYERGISLARTGDYSSAYDIYRSLLPRYKIYALLIYDEIEPYLNLVKEH